LALWYCDDGVIDWGYRTKIRHPTRNVKPTATFCTDSFSKKENELISNWFNTKWGIIKLPRFHSNI